jgi:hypothetical protein
MLPDSWIVILLRYNLMRIGAPRRTGHMRWVSAAGTSLLRANAAADEVIE